MRKLGTLAALPLAFVLGCANPGGSSGPTARTLLSWAPNEAGPDESEPVEARGSEETAGGGDADEPLVTDRPDFTEASSTVGKGRVQLEAGYTFFRDRNRGITTTLHSYPETLLRVGVLADWLELRVGQNFGNARTNSPDGGVFSDGGAQDLYLGAKLGLTSQRGLLPETALILQGLVPTGTRAFTADEVLPGVNYLYGWDVIEDCLTLGASTQINRAIDDTAHGYANLAQSLTVGYTLTKRSNAYTEWFAFIPAGARSGGVTAQHYLNGGVTYRLTPNVQFDVRAGCGLSRLATDLFAGTGVAVRY